MIDAWGEVDDLWWWQESESGTTLERRGLHDVLDFCRSNPRPPANPGRVEWWAPHRFGRSLDAAGKPDILAFIAVYSHFERTGWELHFLTVPRVGDALGDVISIAVHAYAAAVYSQDLSKHAKRGRQAVGSQGWWVNAGAPWGTKRKDTTTGQVLEPGEDSSPGGGGVVLVPDPAILPIWDLAAGKLLEGASYKGIGEALFDRGIRGPRGGALGHTHIKNFLTNRHLIGEVLVKNSSGVSEWHDAKWDSLVDLAVFEKVQAEVAKRKSHPRNLKRTSKGTFIVKPVCAHCGTEYHGGRNGKKQGNSRTYVHGQPHKLKDPQKSKAFHENGCRAWSVLAEDFEEQLKDLIVRERMSESYEEEIRAVLEEQQAFRAEAGRGADSAEKRVAELRQKYSEQVRIQMAAAGEGLDTDAFIDELKRTQQRLQAAEADLREAKEFAASRELAWDRIVQTLDESRNLAQVWDRVGLDERRILLDWWVLDILIVVEPIPGKKRANEKSAIVTLATAPDTPRYFELGPPCSARSNSSRTDSSTSSTKASSKATKASGDAMRPSAHAECPRTSGLGSDSAAANTGTASADPQLPKATATLRRNPARLERVSGDPLENDFQAASSMDINSINDGKSVPGCQASAGSGSTPSGSSPGILEAYAGCDGTEGPNLRECGHTS